MNERISFRTIFREKELWLLVLIGVLYFYRPLFLGETLFFRDIGSNILIHKQILADFIRAGEWPLWNPYWHGGQPYLANVPYFPLYPFNLLYAVLPFFLAYNLTFILHVIGCAVCAYLVSRRIGFSPVSSFMVGLIYGFCGYTLSLVNHGCRILAMPYIPLLLMCWHRFLLEKRKKWLLATVVFGMLQVLAGSPETNIITMLTLLGWALCYPYPHISTFRKLVSWILLAACTIGLSAFQILPMLELLLRSSRGHGMDYTTFSYWSLSLKRLPELVLPGFLGRIDALPVEAHFWGHPIVDQGIPYILSIYFGWVTLILAIGGGIYRPQEKGSLFPFQTRLFLLIVAISSLLLSVGRHLPFFYTLYRSVPLVNIFRHPIKALNAGVFPLALLAGYGAEKHFGTSALLPAQPKLSASTKRSVSFPKLLMIGWGMAGFFILLTCVFWLSRTFSARVLECFFVQSGGEIAWRGVGQSLLHATAVWLLLMLLYQARSIRRKTWQHGGLAGILALDLFIAAQPVNPSAPKEFFSREPELVQLVRQEIGGGRLYRTKSDSTSTLVAPSAHAVWFYRRNLETLQDYLGAFYRVPIIFHSDVNGFASTQLMHLKSLLEIVPWERRLPLLSAGRVTVILTENNLSLPGIQPIASVTQNDTPLYLYRNNTATALLEFVTTWKYVSSDEEAIHTMLGLDYDPRKQVVLQHTPVSFFQRFSPTAETSQTTSAHDSCHGTFQAQEIVSTPHSTSFSVSNSCDGYLVFSEPYYPGWRVLIDGKPVPLQRANLAFSAIFLPGGEHEVRRWYFPYSLLWGGMITIIFAITLLLCGHKGWFLTMTKNMKSR